jgi:hypothetical protein
MLVAAVSRAVMVLSVAVLWIGTPAHKYKNPSTSDGSSGGELFEVKDSAWCDGKVTDQTKTLRNLPRTSVRGRRLRISTGTGLSERKQWVSFE